MKAFHVISWPILFLFPYVLFHLLFSANINEVKNQAKVVNSKDTVWIFNGNNLSNLRSILVQPVKNIKQLYRIKNNSIYFKGGYKGYFRTKKKYSDFKLHAEWKWTEKKEKGNSGILLFIQPPDTIWPKCVQINFKKNHAGDLIAMNGASFKEAIGKKKNTAVILSNSSENLLGKWNECDIISQADSLSVYINGVLQNKATKIKNNFGTIGWQLEGKSIALRNFYLIKSK